MRREPFFGSVLIIAIGVMSIGDALGEIIERPNWLGVIFAVSGLVVGLMAGMSIYRDRVE